MLIFFFVDLVVKKQNALWVQTKKMFTRAGKARAELQDKVRKRIEETTVKQFLDFSSSNIFFRSQNQLLMKAWI